MERKEEIIRRGEAVYRTQTPYTGINARRYADAASARPAQVILAEERFVTGHDDTAGFVEIIDADDRVIRAWKFDYPMTKRFCDPDYYDDDCLIFYLQETLGLPVMGDRAPQPTTGGSPCILPE